MELVVDNVTKRFGDLVAVRSCSLTVQSERIFALIGPNGSGKTTLFNVITGFTRPDGGNVLVDGRRITRRSPAKISKMGVVRTFQLPRVFSHLTVEENVWAARPGAEEKRVTEMLDLVSLFEVRDRRAEHLSYGQKKELDLARALILEPSFILLDEPTAGIEPSMVQSIVGQVRKIHREGTGVFIIEHNMGVVMNLADYIYVLHNGEKIAEGPPSKVQNDERVIDAYFGRG